MNRREIAGGLFLAVVAASRADAQRSTERRRIGVLTPWRPGDLQGTTLIGAFRQELDRLGWTEDRATLIVRDGGDDLDHLPALAAELVDSRVDDIVAAGSVAIEAARMRAARMPIIMATVGDAIGAGFVQSLARPGGNITGFTQITAELSAKRIELIKEVVPGIDTAAIIWAANNPSTRVIVEATIDAAKSADVRMMSFPIKAGEDIEPAIRSAAAAKASALLTSADAFALTFREQIAALAMDRRLPVFGVARETAEAGGLLAYGPSRTDLWRRSAGYVDRILKGESPGDLPVQQPNTFELVINARTARQLDMTIPASLLARADEVIE